jgi:hypothetical protein
MGLSLQVTRKTANTFRDIEDGDILKRPKNKNENKEDLYVSGHDWCINSSYCLCHSFFSSAVNIQSDGMQEVPALYGYMEWICQKKQVREKTCKGRGSIVCAEVH